MKEKMVTRTVTTTIANVMVVEVKEAKAYTTTFRLAGYFKDNADILKYIKKNDSDELVFAAIVSVETEETLYGMPESVFIAHAEVLPSRGTKEA